MEEARTKYGVRIYPLPSGSTIIVKQTVKRGGRYVVDSLLSGLHCEAYVDSANDHDVAEAIRRALKGILLRSIYP